MLASPLLLAVIETPEAVQGHDPCTLLMTIGSRSAIGTIPAARVKGS
ncbi:hypothetical protein KBY96_15270 [Cyanobium sp. ATX 6A2]|nr:hypothetical protein [Cyanobium sp. ATX 6A2]MCP9889277.1 hypothetical protein [Cyanobium sp. ATX 6A2]